MVFLALGALIAGMFYGLSDLNVSWISALTTHTDYILYILMFISLLISLPFNLL